MDKQLLSEAFLIPNRIKVTDLISNTNKAFVSSIIPVIDPTAWEVREALRVLGMTPDTIECVYCGDKCTQWDHLNPLVKDKAPTGYITEIHNLVPCCSDRVPTVGVRAALI